ncbi:GntR family transcriptional regulator [Bacillus sp. FJAT-47783]|uniref:GntR family transcriptional regulator n=1 Tax=Bacillus sp. FJAT-47783 TaxID=2922712 RepID=UPI001FAE0B1E|nr:GntR family transcriptional regulator [Bacillus sp. FJAT-47783]
MSTFNEKVDTRNLNERVYFYLQNKIITNQLKPGSRINYQELIDELGVSKTPLRDAINRLQQDGFIEIKPRSGTFVKSPNVKDIIEIFDVRKALEREAIALAIDRIPQATISQLLNRIDQVDLDIKSGEIESFLQLDRDIHHSIIHYTNNARLIQIMDSLQAHIYWIATMLTEKLLERSLLANAHHRQILNAMMKRDVKLAQEIMEEHIEVIKEVAASDLT